MRHASLAFLGFLMLTGCIDRQLVSVAGARRAGPDPALVHEAIDNAAQQVRRCFRAPRGVGSAVRRVSTVIGVRFNPDGSLAELPVILSQTGVSAETAFAAAQLGQAAIAAAVHCAPLGLPPQLYAHGWDSFELTFSFAAAA